ncbi:MAG TPA: ABC transporter substrate-binding protein [Paracoccus solventivorans]|uniref:ABC transporter substrate-binding protein n=2 Tax=Paracoccus solventivorans TaxID=53463 RepID=A0A832QY73_9RHOB|nr:ABC transporter substrate-binding protein [Paracoccus solventivorans]HHW34710.1 ABC transporter substrate-binding protein [Paracoccus solventivorans]
MVGRLLRAGCIALGLWLGGAVHAAPPQRVVSMNLCTDQLAMLLAAPGQLVSVSYLAQDPQASTMVEQARAYPVNHGLAEEIYRLRPDLVLAGAYTTRATVAMLQRLGVPVAIFPPEADFDGIRGNLRRMGELLGREAEAEAQIAAFDHGLAALMDAPVQRPTAALYYANSYTSGRDSLAGRIVEAAGLHNIAADAGLSGGGVLALEQLVLANPDLLIRGRRYAGRSRAEEVLDHPAVAALAERAGQTGIADQDWVCGTPRVLGAIARLRDARLGLEQGS